MGRIAKKWNEWKPTVVPTFVVHVTPRESPVENVDDEFEIVDVTTPDHPLLPRICVNKRQLAIATAAIAEKRWHVIVATKDGEPVGRIWEGYAPEKGFFTGVPRFRLGEGETFMFDLFVEREYRRSSVAWTMADYFFKMYDPAVTTVKYVYGFIAYDNVPSIMWHHSVGFTIDQTVNLLQIGPFIKWRIPFSDVPHFGPLSKKNRMTDPDHVMFGPPLLP